MSTQNKPQVAVVGCGYWGKNIVRNFYNLGALKYIWDDDPAARAKMQEQHPGLQVAPSFEAVLSDPQVAGIVLATPAVVHYTQASMALKAGKHVFVEKPMALDLEEGRELVKIAADKGLTLMVDHLLRQHPAYVALKELVQSGALGRIRHINARRLNFGKIQGVEDVLWSVAPHYLSMVIGLLDKPPISVSARGESWVTPGIADLVESHLDFGGGVTAQITVSWINPIKEQKLVVIGEDKMAVFDDNRPWPEKLCLYPHQITWANQRPTAVAGAEEKITLVETEPLTAQCRDFLGAIVGEVKPITNGEEGLRVLEALTTLSASMKNSGA